MRQLVGSEKCNTMCGEPIVSSAHSNEESGEGCGMTDEVQRAPLTVWLWLTERMYVDVQVPHSDPGGWLESIQHLPGGNCCANLRSVLQVS